MLALVFAVFAFAGEPELLKKYPKLFERSGDTLTVFTAHDSRKYQDSWEETGDDRVVTRLESYDPKLKVVVLSHRFRHGESDDILSLATGKTLHVGSVPPEWFNGIFATYAPRLLIGLCDKHGCDKLLERDGSDWTFHGLGHDQLQVSEKVTCKVNRRKRTAECTP